MEGAAPSAPWFAARKRDLVDRNGAGLRSAKVGRHGGHPSTKLQAIALCEPSQRTPVALCLQAQKYTVLSFSAV